MSVKKSQFNGVIHPWNGMVFGTLADKAEVIIANSIADAKALVGCTVEYETEGKVNKIKSIQL